MAVAAATSGLTRWVRPPLPCRPSKLRLDVEALRSPGARVSGFIPRHIEQPGQAPLRPGLGEDGVEALGLGLEAHLGRAGDDEHAHAVGDLVALDDRGGGPQVLDAAVGARADEDGVDPDVAQRRARPRGPCRRARWRQTSRSPSSAKDSGSGTESRQRQALAGVGAPRDEGGQLGRVEVDLRVEDRVVVAAQGGPLGDGGVPVGTPRRVRAALEVVEGRLVGRDHAGAGAGLDRHVADRHPSLHRQGLDGVAAVLDDDSPVRRRCRSWR